MRKSKQTKATAAPAVPAVPALPIPREPTISEPAQGAGTLGMFDKPDNLRILVSVKPMRGSEATGWKRRLVNALHDAGLRVSVKVWAGALEVSEGEGSTRANVRQTFVPDGAEKPVVAHAFRVYVPASMTVEDVATVADLTEGARSGHDTATIRVNASMVHYGSGAARSVRTNRTRDGSIAPASAARRLEAAYWVAYAASGRIEASAAKRVKAAKQAKVAPAKEVARNKRAAVKERVRVMERAPLVKEMIAKAG